MTAPTAPHGRVPLDYVRATSIADDLAALRAHHDVHDLVTTPPNPTPGTIGMTMVPTEPADAGGESWSSADSPPPPAAPAVVPASGRGTGPGRGGGDGRANGSRIR